MICARSNDRFDPRFLITLCTENARKAIQRALFDLLSQPYGDFFVVQLPSKKTTFCPVRTP
jgi:hypothetical protein